MSDDLMAEDIVRRTHRCVPPRRRARLTPVAGMTWRCGCGTEYQYVETKFGRQWLPAFDPAR